MNPIDLIKDIRGEFSQRESEEYLPKEPMPFENPAIGDLAKPI
jgi:hypothetical protein